MIFEVFVPLLRCYAYLWCLFYGVVIGVGIFFGVQSGILFSSAAYPFTFVASLGVTCWFIAWVSMNHCLKYSCEEISSLSSLS
jgi:hypothetical protein